METAKIEDEIKPLDAKKIKIYRNGLDDLVVELSDGSKYEKVRAIRAFPLLNPSEFIGLRDDMTVIEFLPAAQAYYTKILGPVLVDNGHLMTVDNSNTFSSWGDWTEEPEFKMTHPVVIENNYSREEGRYVPGEIEFGVAEADLFLHFREYHNFNEADNMRINAKVFDTLKSGGEYVVVDHTRRHMQPETGVLGRREDPVDVILQVQRAGFVLDRASTMFFEESDDLSKEVGQIPNMTDRFFLVFKKP